jgi:hypothetical protein
MDTEELYIHMIDGIDNYIPIPAQTLDGVAYEILNDPIYEEVSPIGALFEFYPGDWVEVNNDHTPLQEYQYAGPVISKGLFPDRKYYEFLYRATTQTLEFSDQNILEYQEEIKRVQGEINNGKVFYRNVRELLKHLEKLDIIS